jgi:hypothetical protein
MHTLVLVDSAVLAMAAIFMNVTGILLHVLDGLCCPDIEGRRLECDRCAVTLSCRAAEVLPVEEVLAVAAVYTNVTGVLLCPVTLSWAAGVVLAAAEVLMAAAVSLVTGSWGLT